MKRNVQIEHLKIKKRKKNSGREEMQKEVAGNCKREDVTNNFGSTTKVHKLNIYIYIYYIFFFFIINKISLSRIHTDTRTPFRYISQYSKKLTKKRKKKIALRISLSLSPFSFFLDTSFFNHQRLSTGITTSNIYKLCCQPQPYIPHSYYLLLHHMPYFCQDLTRFLA